MDPEFSPTWRGALNGVIVGFVLIVAFPTVLKQFPLPMVSPEMAKSSPNPGDGSGAGWGVLLVIGAPSFLMFTGSLGALVGAGLQRVRVGSRVVQGGMAGLVFAAAFAFTSTVVNALPSNLLTMGLAVTMMFAGPVGLAASAVVAAVTFAIGGQRLLPP